MRRTISTLIYRLMRLIRRMRWILARRARASVPTLRALRAKAVRNVQRFLVWMRAVQILALWISFEAHIGGWRFLQQHAGQKLGLRTSGWQRLVYCVLLSLTADQIALLMLTGLHLSAWTMLICAVHGLAVHFTWTRGVRWCKQQLGVRPSRSYDPAKPFANLDLGSE